MFHDVLEFGHSNRLCHLKSCKFMVALGIWPLDENKGTLTITRSQPLAPVQTDPYYQLVVHCNAMVISCMLASKRQFHRAWFGEFP